MNMVERVAKALEDHNNRDAGWDLPPEMFTDAARSAIEAMRLPSWAMKIAGRDVILDGDDDLDLSTDDVHAAWVAMIEAALNERR